MIASGLFDRFLASIQPTRAQIDRVTDKQQEVSQVLHDHYYATAFDGSTSLLIGGLRKQTAVRLHVDVDVLFRMPYRMYCHYQSIADKGPSQLIQDVKGVLEHIYAQTILRQDGQAISVPFESFAVHVAPAFGLARGRYLRPVVRTHACWKTVHPETEDACLTELDARNQGTTRQLIRLAKAWKYACNVPIKSLALELLAVEFVKRRRHMHANVQSLDRLVAEFLNYMVGAAGGFAFIPGTQELALYGTEWKNKAEAALRHAEKACRYSARERHSPTACAEWCQVFGCEFASVTLPEPSGIQ